MAFSIIYNSVNVNTLDTSSAISIGENSFSNFKAPSKNNFGNGMFFGVNYTLGAINSILDTDYIDTPVIENDVISSPQLQSV